MTIIPAYGRDYKSAKDAKADFDNGKDFIIADISSPYNGKYCNKRDLEQANIHTVNIRFKKLANITVVKF